MQYCTYAMFTLVGCYVNESALFDKRGRFFVKREDCNLMLNSLFYFTLFQFMGYIKSVNRSI